MDQIYASPASYKISAFLGEGLNSCVYRAIKENDNLGVGFEVALKILKSENLVELWRNEFSRLASVKSQHCVGLLGWEFIYNKPALVLEYVNGVTLEDLIEYQNLNSCEISEIYTQVAAGLRDLKRANLFHGDLNTHNIMINCNGIVKLVDFGVAYSDRHVMTTAKFASPDLLSGAKPSYETDMFSLEAIAIHMAERTGISFFACTTNKKTNKNIRSELAEKVKSAKQIKGQRLGRTQTLMRLKKIEWNFAKIARFVGVAMLIGTSFLSYGDQPRLSSKELAYLQVRTNSWVKLSLNGVDHGFAPLSLIVVPFKTYQLSWQTAETSGQTSLTPSRAQHIVLDDEFFRSHSVRHSSRRD